MMKTFSGQTRQRMSEAAKRRCTPEWRRAMSERQATNLPLDYVTNLYNNGMTQTELAEHFGVTQKVIWGFMRRNDIPSRVAAKRDQRASKNSSWKGDDAGYQACHVRVIAARGQPSACEECGTITPDKSYDWANLTGAYHDIQDYKRLCRSCHWKLDRTIMNLRKGENARG